MIIKYFEFRQQLEFPFNGKHPLHGKPIHVHIQDALNSIKSKTKVEDYTSTGNVSSEISKNWSDALNDFLNEEWTDYYYVDFMIQHKPDKYPEYYDKDEIKEYEKDYDFSVPNDIDSIGGDNIYSMLTDIGNEKMDEFMSEFFDDDIRNFEYNLDVDNDGLVLIYREMTFNTSEKTDAYEEILKHEGLGVYWAWNENSAEAHGGDGSNAYIFFGKVKIENINWRTSMFKNAYSLKDEEEIEVLDGVDILIYKIEKSGEKSIDIDPIIVSSGY